MGAITSLRYILEVRKEALYRTLAAGDGSGDFVLQGVRAFSSFWECCYQMAVFFRTVVF